jgi:predicted amidophosphoribosyltransferase
MAVKVVCFCAYLTSINIPWRDDDYNANKFISAFKGEPINGYAKILVGKTWHRLQESNRDSAVGWFGEMAAEYVKQKHKTRPLAFCPIPSSKAVAGGKVVSSTYRLAEAITSNLQDVTVWDGLRWSAAKVPAHLGGPRDPHYFYEHLVIVKKLPDAEIVLVDDMFTSGSHMQAANAKLVKKGGKCRLCLCAGRQVEKQVNRPFDIIEEELQPFVP